VLCVDGSTSICNELSVNSAPHKFGRILRDGGPAGPTDRTLAKNKKFGKKRKNCISNEEGSITNHKDFTLISAKPTWRAGQGYAC